MRQPVAGGGLKRVKLVDPIRLAADRVEPRDTSDEQNQRDDDLKPLANAGWSGAQLTNSVGVVRVAHRDDGIRSAHSSRATCPTNGLPPTGPGTRCVPGMIWSLLRAVAPYTIQK